MMDFISISTWTYLADIRNISNMYPYGKSYPATATYNADDDYRYGFNGMEKEKSFDSDGDVADFGARIFDANYPVFLSRDPLENEFPFQSPYLISENNPVLKIDVNGEWAWVVNLWLSSGNSELKLYNTKEIARKEAVYITRIENKYFDYKKVENRLNNMYHKFSDPNSSTFSPKVADALKNKQINIVIAEFKDEEGSPHSANGITINNSTIILNKDMFSTFHNPAFGESRLGKLVETFLHEMVHNMGGSEFDSFSATFSAGLMTKVDVKSEFTSLNKINYLLEGSGYEAKDFFVLIDRGEVGRDPEKQVYKLNPSKETEFFELMQNTGDEVLGKNEGDKDEN